MQNEITMTLKAV